MSEARDGVTTLRGKLTADGGAATREIIKANIYADSLQMFRSEDGFISLIFYTELPNIMGDDSGGIIDSGIRVRINAGLARHLSDNLDAMVKAMEAGNDG